MSSIFYSPVEAYAADIESGRIVANKYIKLAVARYRALQGDTALYFDIEEAQRFHKFSGYCCHVKGELYRHAIKLENWQLFAVLNFICWKHKSTDKRVFQELVYHVPRKNGKSLIMSVLCNYFLVNAEQHELISAGTTSKQSRIVFDACKEQINASKALRKKAKTWAHKITTNNSDMQPVSSNISALEGKNVSVAVFDEYAQYKDDSIPNVIRLGMAARQEPLSIYISTAGDTGTPYENLIATAKKVLAGEAQSPKLWAVLYELDDIAEVNDPTAWEKANPNLGVSIRPEELQDRVDEMKLYPSRKREIIVKRFNLFVSAQETGFLSVKHWNGLADSQYQHKGRIYVGMDLSKNRDITALCFLSERDDGRIHVSFKYHCIKENLESGHNADFLTRMAHQGFINAHDSVAIDYQEIEKDIQEQANRLKVIGYDPYAASQLVKTLDEKGFTLEVVRQGAVTMSPMLQDLQSRILKGEITHDGNPLTEFMIGNLVVEYGKTDLMSPSKSRSKDKIDGVSAMLTALKPYSDDKFFEISGELIAVDF
jgi:phage terminase large subunit-like protein